MFRISEKKISEISLSNKSEQSVAYSLKTRIVESQQLGVTIQRPLNNRGMVFSVHSMPMVAHAAIEYIIPSITDYSSLVTYSAIFVYTNIYLGGNYCVL
jgi:hypothetical protein